MPVDGRRLTLEHRSWGMDGVRRAASGVEGSPGMMARWVSRQLPLAIGRRRRLVRHCGNSASQLFVDQSLVFAGRQAGLVSCWSDVNDRWLLCVFDSILRRNVGKARASKTTPRIRSHCWNAEACTCCRVCIHTLTWRAAGEVRH